MKISRKKGSVFGSTAVKQRGFNLIEMLIVIVILGVLVAVAVPTFQEQSRKTYRHLAKSRLILTARDLERFYNREGTYTGAVLAPHEIIWIDGRTASTGPTEDRLYRMSIKSNSDEFTLYATRVTGGIMENDRCGSLAINNTGQKYADTQTVAKVILSATTTAPDATSQRCWD